MTVDQVIQLVTQVGGVVLILARMRSYVTVDEYRTKTSSLHAEINALKVQVARLEERAAK
jgi:hypothetical protein